MIGSDHRPILLDSNVKATNKRNFKLQATWARRENIMAQIQEYRNKGGDGFSLQSLCRKLQTCKENQQIWNREVFGQQQNCCFTGYPFNLLGRTGITKSLQVLRGIIKKAGNIMGTEISHIRVEIWGQEH